MRFRIGLALCLSLILISSTVWFRSRSNNGPAPTLVSVANPQINAGPALATNLDAYNAENPEAALTTTDLVGRQLAVDYINLIQSDQISEEAIDNLIEQYVGGVGNLQLSLAPVITLAEIITVADTKANFVAYDDITTQIDNERVNKANQAYGQGQDLDTLSSGIYILAQTIGEAYERAAAELKKIKVPTSLASLHLKLINNYLSTALGMKSIANTENDSTMAMAGMISASRNIEEEKQIVNQIIGILIKNGV